MTLSFRFAWLTLFSIGSFALPLPTFAAQLYVSPASGAYSVGSTFTVSIRVDTAGQAVNTGEVTASYSSNTLELVQASQGSTFSLATPGSPQKGSGTVYFGGGIPSPGYTGSGGTLGTLTFRVRGVGKGTVSLTGGKTLLNDGFGTDAFQGARGAEFTFAAATPGTPLPVMPGAPTVSSATHSDQDAWYKASAPSFIWAVGNGTNAVSFEFDQTKDTVPDMEADEAGGNATAYARVDDGVWYFHIRARTGSIFGGTTHYRIQVDTTPPEEFPLHVSTDVSGTPTITFETSDELSGVAYYDVKVDDVVVAEKAESPVTLSSVTRGRHVVSVLAYDHAGNVQEAHTTILVDKNVMISLTLITLLLALNLLITLLLLIVIWLELSNRRRTGPVSARVKRAQQEIQARLESLRGHMEDRLGTIEDVPAKDIVTKEKALKYEMEGLLADAKKDIGGTIDALGDIPANDEGQK